MANDGLVLPMTLADRLGLWTGTSIWVTTPGHANVGRTRWPSWVSALVGGDGIDDADVLGAGSAADLLGPLSTCLVQAAGIEAAEEGPERRGEGRPRAARKGWTVGWEGGTNVTTAQETSVGTGRKVPRNRE